MVWIKRLYIIFVGIILSITTGFGVAAFYPEPVSPQYPTPSFSKRPIVPQSCYQTVESTQSAGCQRLLAQEKESNLQDEEKRKQYEEDLKVYQNWNAGYTRTAIFIGIAIGAVFAIVGLSLIKLSRLISNGLLFAGILTAVLTRFLIKIASLGANVTGTEQANTIAFVEFAILLALSVAVIVVGVTTLKENLNNQP